MRRPDFGSRKPGSIKAEEKILELSGSGLSISSSRGHHSNYRYTTEPKRVTRKDNFNVKNSGTRGREEAVTVQTHRPHQDTVNAAAASSNSVFEQYLERQGRSRRKLVTMGTTLPSCFMKTKFVN